MTVALGALNLTSTYDSISIEQLISGDDGTATATATYTPHGGGTARSVSGIGENFNKLVYLYQPDDSNAAQGSQTAGSGFYGKAHLLQALGGAGSSWDITVTVTYTVLGGGTLTKTATATLLPENLPTTFTPDRYVDAINGSDTYDGTSATHTSGTVGPWKTYDHAIAQLNAGGVAHTVQFASGAGQYYAISDRQLTQAGCALFAQTPRIGATTATYSGRTYNLPTPINQGAGSVLYGLYTSPTGSGDANAGVWVLSGALTGPGGGGTYHVWTWTAPVTFNGGPPLAVYCATKDGTYKLIAPWQKSSPSNAVGSYTLNTQAGFAELVQTSPTLNQGVWNDGLGNLSLYMPANVNPNSYYLFFSNPDSNGIEVNLNAANCEVYGFEFRCVNLSAQVGCNNFVDDHNYYEHCVPADRGNKSVSPRQYASVSTHQWGYCNWSNMWALNGDDANNLITWNFIKGNVGVPGFANGYGSGPGGLLNNPGGPALFGGAKPTIIRHWVCSGHHDGITISDSSGAWDRYDSYGTDIYQTYRENGQDDAIEWTGRAVNQSFWDNPVRYTLTQPSIGQGFGYGPVYFCRNQLWRCGSDGEPQDNGNYGSNQYTVPGGTPIKYGSAGATPLGWFLAFHNTWWTDSARVVTPTGYGPATFDVQVQPSAGSTQNDRFAFANNIVRVSSVSRVGKWPANTTATSHDFFNADGNVYSAPGNANAAGSTDETTLAAWQAATGEDAHAQPGTGWTGFANNAALDAMLTAPTSGDLRPLGGAAIIGASPVKVPNWSDVPIATNPVDGGGGYPSGQSGPTPGAIEYAPPSGAKEELMMMGLGV